MASQRMIDEHARRAERQMLSEVRGLPRSDKAKVLDAATSLPTARAIVKAHRMTQVPTVAAMRAQLEASAARLAKLEAEAATNKEARRADTEQKAKIAAAFGVHDPKKFGVSVENNVQTFGAELGQGPKQALFDASEIAAKMGAGPRHAAQTAVYNPATHVQSFGAP